MIESFIKHFSSFGKPVVECFTQGNCYWFARILTERFGGEIMYSPQDNHFAALINNKLYDITGRISATSFVSWNAYCFQDPLHASRITKDCINF